MDIDWYGQACFRIREGRVAIVTDPYDRGPDIPLPRVRADIVTASCVPEDADRPRGIRGSPRILQSAGEYEIGEVFVTGISTLLKRTNPPQNNVVFVYDFDGLTVCHLGRIDDLLQQNQVEVLNAVDVLFIPIDSERTLTADQAAELMQMIEPRIVIPMHLDPTRLEHDPASVVHLLHAVGVDKAPTEETLRLRAGHLPEETQIILLECKR
ncbi:MAG: MBL fold metallo-hydrolase [Anaerolineae bacterium]|nr:MBL fold metallo-hydrolase [Anaerolineae bacterium]